MKANRPSRANSRNNGAQKWRYARCVAPRPPWKILPHIFETTGAIERLGASFESLTEKVSTGGAKSRLVFHLFASLAEFEHDLINQLTNGGRKPSLDPKAVKLVRALMTDISTRPVVIAAQYKISKSTLYRIVRDHGNA